MNIFPTSYRLFGVIENTNRIKAKIYFYNEEGLIEKGEIKNLSPKEFDHLRKIVDDQIKINNSDATPFVVGIIDLQYLIKEQLK